MDALSYELSAIGKFSALAIVHDKLLLLLFLNLPLVIISLLISIICAEQPPANKNFTEISPVPPAISANF